MDLGREIRHMARKRRKRGLDRLLEDPEQLLARPHEAFALLVGNRDGGGRGLTRAEFCQVCLFVCVVCVCVCGRAFVR